MVRHVLDSHTHAFPDRIAAGALETLTAEALWMPVRTYHDGTPAGLLASMDRAEIGAAIMCSVATKPAQVTKITDWSAAIACERIIPFASVHPDYESPEAEIERIAALGLRGLKFHPQYMQCAVDDPRCLRIARAAAKANLAMTFHAGYDLAFERDQLAGPQQFRKLHQAVPDLRLLACHLGGWQRWEEVAEHLVGLPIYLETSFVFGQCPPALMERLLAKHPPEYVLFGSDAPWADQADELAKFQALAISEEVNRCALWENARRFAGLDG